MPLRPDLFAAYRRAEYVVFNPAIAFRIGEPSVALDRLLEQHGAASAAFVTAANPDGEVMSEAENRTATAAMREDLAAKGRACFQGEGRDPDDEWVAEPSLLVLGLSRQDAETLGRTYEQNAIVFVERGGAPELVVLTE